MKVLVVKLSALGDILHAVPAVASLGERPDVEVGWAVDKRYSAVLALVPRLDHVHVLDPKGWGRDLARGRLGRVLSSARRELVEIRRLRYDVALDLQGLFKSALAARLAGAREVVGFTAENCRERGAALLYGRKVPVDSRLPVDVQIRSLIEAAVGELGEIPVEPLSVPPAAVLEAGEILARAHLSRPAVLVAGAGWPTKVLPLPVFREVAGLLAAGGVAVLSGNDEERERAMAMVEGLPAAAVFHRLPFPLLAGLFRHARVVVGGDTGPIHLAALLGTPTVSFYGASSGERSGPRGPLHRQVQAPLSCSPCFRRSCDDVRCMRIISAESIFAAVREVAP